MKRAGRIFIMPGVLAWLLLVAVLNGQAAQELSVKEAVETAIDAYIYGYPLITFDMARKQQTNVVVPDEEHAPMGQLIKVRKYLDVDNHCCAAPNQDTLYTMAWLDVTAEPYVFGLPDMGVRYAIFPMHDGFSEVIMVAGSGNTGTGPQAYVITGPGWTGSIPDGLTQVKSPTGIVWILGRIYCTGTQEDYTAVNKLQDNIIVLPLSAYGKPYSPPKGIVDPSFDMKTAVRKQVNDMDINTYFDYLARLLKTNPPKAEDAELVARMAKIGLLPGEDFDKDKLGFIDSVLLNTVPKLGLLEMARYMKKQKTTNGWLYFTEGVGNFGTNYVLRGMANLLGPGWNRPREAVYPIAKKDIDGHKLNGAKHSYTIHFPKGQLPPVEAFWSLTMYDNDMFLVPNAINRYTMSNRDTFITNKDGSIDLYLQAESPGKDKETNWLPAPKGSFTLVLRLYDPPKTAPTILDGSWKPPAVRRVE